MVDRAIPREFFLHKPNQENQQHHHHHHQQQQQQEDQHTKHIKLKICRLSNKRKKDEEPNSPRNRSRSVLRLGEVHKAVAHVDALLEIIPCRDGVLDFIAIEN